MSDDVKALQEERNQIYHDIYNNKIPKRVPVAFGFNNQMLAEFGGVDVFNAQFDNTMLAPTAEKVCDMLYSDKCPIPASNIVMTRPPMVYQILGSQSFVMGANGFVQHPEVVGMPAEDYDYLIEDPYACILERVIPRQYKNIDVNDAPRYANNMAAARLSLANDFNKSIGYVQKFTQQYGYYKGAPLGSSGFTVAPYDFLGDQLRSFSQISLDIRRDRKKVAEAAEAVLPFMFYWGLPANPNPEGSVFMPLHMPTFMREKDFAEVWLPPYMKLIEQYAALGVRPSAFCEDNYMRYLDYLSDMPAGMQLWFEYGDAQAIKDKLGKKFIINGLYPITLTKTGTKQQVLDKAQELLDIMMPGGNYLFGFDKNPINLKDINVDNYVALAEYIRDNAVYSNAGESCGIPLNDEGYKFSSDIIKPLKSKYFTDMATFNKEYPYSPEAANKLLNSFEMDVMKFNLNLLT